MPASSLVFPKPTTAKSYLVCAWVKPAVSFAHPQPHALARNRCRCAMAGVFSLGLSFRRAPSLTLLQVPPVVGLVPATTAHFVMAVTAPAPGVSSTVSAVVVNEDTGAVVASLPNTPRGVFTVTGLTPGANYSLHANCVDATGGACVEVVHRWRTMACPAANAEEPTSVRAVSVVPGERFVSWVSPGDAFEYSVDGGPWMPVPDPHPGVPPSGVTVRGVASQGCLRTSSPLPTPLPNLFPRVNALCMLLRHCCRHVVGAASRCQGLLRAPATPWL
jgi:hypothetical protein